VVTVDDQGRSRPLYSARGRQRSNRRGGKRGVIT
jgi:hypothetical protein